MPYSRPQSLVNSCTNIRNVKTFATKKIFRNKLQTGIHAVFPCIRTKRALINNKKSCLKIEAAFFIVPAIA